MSWADEVLVVDSGSRDRTREIAESIGARVIVHEWQGFSEQKQFAADAAANDWIFSLDADERVSEELKCEIETIKNGTETNRYDGYKIPRLSIYMNRTIRHSGWYPDRQLRFFDRRRGKWNGRIIHESVQMNEDAGIGHLSGDIIHHTVENAAEHHRMIGERYAPMAARQMLSEGRRTNAAMAVFAFMRTFIVTYFFKAGFLDGLPGLCISYFAAHHAFLKHLILKEIQDAAGK